MESQPQNLEFKNNNETLHQSLYDSSFDTHGQTYLYISN